ncbi:hypothetical protein [Tenacibaculum insulae]|uniref:hypothetical protein n=1 Tax=Tenacibaculum insulae TaxID=2029677 RepID=UPI003AB1D09B
MKNLFLTLVFAFGTATSFAESNVIAEKDAGCIHVTLSCGIEYNICDFKGTTKQLIKAVLVNDDAVCAD